MKGIVIFDTGYGNTMKIAETLAETLKNSGLQVDLSKVKDVKEIHAEDYDFLVIGSPTKWGTMSFAIRRFIGGEIKGEGWRDKTFAAFDTELQNVVEKGGASAAEKIAKAFRQGIEPNPPCSKDGSSGGQGTFERRRN